MGRTLLADRAAKRIAAAVHERGISMASLAEAADMTLDDVAASLHGDRPLTIAELVDVGGFLRIAPDALLGAEA